MKRGNPTGIESLTPPAAYAVARSAAGLTALAALSPLAGLAVEMTLAWRLGTSGVVDAFRVAGVFLVLGQQLLLVQILPHVIVPVFSDYAARGEEREAWRVASTLGAILLAVTSAVAAAVFLWPGPLTDFLAPGLGGESRQATVLLVRWFALGYVPLAVSGVLAGVLQVHRVFWPAPAGQLAGHLLIAATVAFAGLRLGAAALVIAVLGASLVGVVLHLSPTLRRWPSRRPGEGLRIALGHPGVRQALRLAAPLAGMFLIVQWAPVVVNRAISEQGPGTLAVFGYAFKMGLLVSLAPLSLVVVLFPHLAWSRADHSGEFGPLAARALRMGLFLSVPLACVAYVLREPLVALLLERGAFTGAARADVAHLFGWLLLGAPASVAAAFAEKIYYADQRMWAPTVVRLAGVALLTVLVPLAGARAGAAGVAGLLTLLSLAAAVALVVPLAGRHPGFSCAALARHAALVTLLGAGSAWLGGQAAAGVVRMGGESASLWLQAASLAAGLVAAGAALLAASLAVALPEAAECARYLRWHLGLSTGKAPRERATG